MTRRPMFSVLTALLCGLCGCGGDPGAAPAGGRSGSQARAPNLLLITLDTTRADRLGCYGYEAAHTPVLDGLAARGVLFEEAYTVAPMTLPAHATLLTGVLPPEHGARVNGMHTLSPEVPSLPELLSLEGYRTGAFVAAFVLQGKFGLSRGFDDYDDDLTGAYTQDVAESLSTYRPGNLVTDAALAWLAEDSERPFFAWVHFYDAHFPWHPHGPEVEDPNAETGTYDGELAFVDEQVGRLLAYLDEQGLADETVVVAVADHGEGLGDHHEVEHAYLLNDEVLHVPLIIAGPGASPGHRVASLVSLEDLQPTLLELLGQPALAGTGRSLAAALRGEELPAGESYAETDLPWTSYRWAPQRSLTTSEWKYIRTPQAELYARDTDREEYANLAASRPAVLVDLERRLRQLEAGLVVRASDAAAISSDELEQLEALGYVGGIDVALPKDTAGLADVKQRLPAKDLATDLRRRVNQKTIEPPEHLELALRLVELSPETPSFHNEVGSAYVLLGDYTRALPYLERVVEMVPTDAGAHYSLGDALQQMGNTPLARSHLELALKFAPDMAAAHVGMGNVLRSEGRSDLAAGEYHEALRLRPEYPEARYNLAMTFLDRNLPDKAIENFERALEHKPGWGLAHRQLALLLTNTGRQQDAGPHFVAALQEFPGDAELHNEFGVLLSRVGRPAEARDEYLWAAELAPGFFRPFLNLGDLAYEHGKDQLALERYEEALRLAPGLAESTARLARFLASTPDPSYRDGPRAVALAERAVDLGAGAPGLLDILGMAYAAAGRLPEAVSSAHKAQQRALALGDQLLAAEIEQRIALYALGDAYAVPRAPPAAAPDTGAAPATPAADARSDH